MKEASNFNNDCYEGEYQNDKKNGFGVLKWQSGNVYKGNFLNDLRNGYGDMFWFDGSFYSVYIQFFFICIYICLPYLFFIKKIKGFWENGI